MKSVIFENQKKALKITLLSPILILLAFTAQSQTPAQLDTMSRQYKSCLDKGSFMLGCSQQYYKQMDSLLNVVYNKMRKPMNATDKLAFKNEQLKWLQKRDAYFKKVDKQSAADSGPGPVGQDFLMIALDEKANFVRKRVEELQNR
ncbi:MAG: lysozyme inhibitor LprI family protein [Adhaeribacter sp.]